MKFRLLLHDLKFSVFTYYGDWYYGISHNRHSLYIYSLGLIKHVKRLFYYFLNEINEQIDLRFVD